jgi:hypothetical protein
MAFKYTLIFKIATLLLGALFINSLAGCNGHATQQVQQLPTSIRFTDVAQKVGLRFSRENGMFGKKWLPETMGGGGGYIDFDNDGRLDILLINGDYWPGHAPKNTKPPTLGLYHNNPDGTFTDVTKQAGLDIHCYGMGIAVGDYDNDGFDDIFITAVGRSRLFHNVPDGRGGRKFVEVTESSGIQDTGWSTSAAWVDYDRDGKLDLFVCHYLKWSPATDKYCGTTFKAYCGPQEYPGESCRLYHNEGNGRFTDVTKKAGVYNENAKALGISVCDLNGDGLPDLIVANDTSPNYLYINKGNGTFEETGVQTGIALSEAGTARAGMGIDLADYRNDGTLGLAIGNFSQEGLSFFDISAAPPYTDRARQSGLYNPTYPYLTFGLFFADFENNGRQDLFITNGHIEDMINRLKPQEQFAQPSQLFLNRGNGTFEDISVAARPGITQPLVGRGACRGDFDNDGRQDILIIPNSGAPRLLHNETPIHNHWITLKLVGIKSNRNAYGSKVRVEAGGVILNSYLSSGSSYLSANDPRLHFGLAAAIKVERVTVQWPNGEKETWGPLVADQFITLTEGRSPQTGTVPTTSGSSNSH